MNYFCNAAMCVLILASSAGAQSGATQAPADRRITVSRVSIEGADRLSPGQIEQVKSAVTGRPELSEELMDTARHLITRFLEGDCYIRASVDLTVVNMSALPDNAWMQIRVQQGNRYRLNKFSVNWETVFSEQQIGQHLPLDAMRRGDCSGLGSVESTIGELYKRQGYRNVKVHSLVQANKATEQFDLTLYIAENK